MSVKKIMMLMVLAAILCSVLCSALNFFSNENPVNDGYKKCEFLAEAMERYREKNGRYPRDLKALVDEKIINDIPKLKSTYKYFPDGEITCDLNKKGNKYTLFFGYYDGLIVPLDGVRFYGLDSDNKTGRHLTDEYMTKDLE